MAVSQKQLVANRRNAARSTGPKTEQGKAIASRNAITHGLATPDIVINSPNLTENAQHYDHLLQSLFDELRPNGLLQQHLVIKIANCLWRYRRLINAETAQISDQLKTKADYSQMCALMDAESDDHEDDDPDQALDPAETLQPDNLAALLIPTSSFRLGLIHYEMRLDKQLARAYKLLYHLQLIDESKRLPTPHSEPEK